MKKGLVLSAITLISALIAVPSAKADPSCYMVDAEGNTINLGYLCGETAQPNMPPPPPSSSSTEATAAAPITPPSISFPDAAIQSGTIYTPEAIDDFMSFCTSEFIYEGQRRGLNISQVASQTFCQCTIDTIRNTYTSQEFIALSTNSNPGVMDAAMLRIAEPCVYKAYGYR